jgi:cyclophilin family peptidyl-prolyl cis-trans isomerase
MKRALRSWLSHAGLVTALVSALSACSKTSPSGPTLSSAASASAGSAPAAASLLGAELRRDPGAVPEDDLIAIEDAKREAAVRALARIQDEQSFAALAKALSDEKPAVVAWAAFGVGHLCRTREPEAVRKLVLRATTVSAQPPDPARDTALRELSLAIGRCASEEAERSLRAWLRLEPELAELAALGLAQLARRRKRLDDATIAALLDAAAKQGSGAYFHPLESLPGLGSAAQQRLLEVARPVLERAEPARAFAIRALAKGDAEAAHPLMVLLEAASTSDGERAEAARSLAALGDAGQSALAAALRQQARSLIDTNAWLTSRHGVVLTMLEGLAPKSADPGALLELAQLPLGDEAPPLLRRKIMLRCRAAALLAGRASASETLLGCDPSPATERREGALALLRVLGRGSLAGARGARFRELAQSSDRVVREAALELLMAHDELPEIAELLANGLSAKEAGVRATAAKVLSRYPARAQLPSESVKQPAAPAIDPRVVQALTSQLGDVATSNNIELSSLLLDAAVALELLGAKPALERACASANPTLRLHAERGLIALGDAKRRCPGVVGSGEPGQPPSREVRLELETDVGSFSLTLRGEQSPFAVERLVDLARSGFYDGQLVHRVVPGFVVQFGDPDGDGFGGPDLPPLRCQLGPEPFEPGSVGIALAGRDTGSSQLFVALRRAPHLDGDYSLIGRAEPGWERLAPGDRILKVRVLEGRSK